MVKQVLPAIVFLFLLASCSGLKSLHLTNTSNKQPAVTTAPAGGTTTKKEVKFIDAITVAPHTTVSATGVKTETKQAAATQNYNTEEPVIVKEENQTTTDIWSVHSPELEAVSASQLQLKYSVLLNTQVAQLQNKELLAGVDEWYGVRYRKGGVSKTGVDCSGFVLSVYAAVYGISLPRVSREQYRISRHISTTELQEGDLLFFATRGGGGVSHVGIYLQNNRFIHASVSRGVTVSGLFEPYYLQRFVGAGRIENKQASASASSSSGGGR